MYSNHEEKTIDEYTATKEGILKKYWKSHDYDPIRGEFYDVKKETNYRGQRDILTLVQVIMIARLFFGAPISQLNCYTFIKGGY